MISHLDHPLLLVGAGKMGTAMLDGWLKHGLVGSQIIIQDPNVSAEVTELARCNGIEIVNEVTAIDAPSVIIMAVKPQQMSDALSSLAPFMAPHTVVMSIAAGKSLASFTAHLPENQAVVRAMPNTPSAIGRGVTGAVANKHVTAVQKALCDELMAAVGQVVWLDKEADIDAVTAVSGSGPAYVFWFIEALAKAGEEAGLNADVAMALARATVSGAGELLHQRRNVSASQLRENVTSPGGTTAAALNVLMAEKNGFQSVVTEAVLAAKKRSRELAN